MNVKDATFDKISEAFRKAELYDAIKEAETQQSQEIEFQDKIHKSVFRNWLKASLIGLVVSVVLVSLGQMILGGFESQIVTDSLLFFTKPLAAFGFISLGMGAVIFTFYKVFPILGKFINEKVNTVSLQETFLQATPDGRLKFLALMLIGIALIISASFSVAKGGQRECINQIAQKEVGTVEEKGINNYGKRIDHYRTISTGRYHKGNTDAWCAYFVGYVLKSCNIQFNLSGGFVGRARDYFRDDSKIVYRKNFQYGVIKPKVRKGDLVGYRFNNGTIGHIGIVKDWNASEGYFTAYEGNTSNLSTVYRDANKQDGVRLKKRKISTAFIVSSYANS